MGSPYPLGQGQAYTLADVAAGLAARGVSGAALSQAVAIVARENGLSAPGAVGYTGRANTSEPDNVSAIGPFQYIQTWHQDFDRGRAAQSLDYNLDYIVSHQLAQNDFSPWVIPGHGAGEFTSPSSPFVQAALQAISQGGGGHQAAATAPSSQPVVARIGAPPAPAPQQQTIPHAPTYSGDQDRYDYLRGLQGRGVTLGQDALDFLNGYHPEAAPEGTPHISPPNAGDAGLLDQAQPPAQSFYGTGSPSAGNMTTADNNQAQAQMDQNYANAQAASQQSYLSSPAVAGALAAQQQQASGGSDGSGQMTQGQQANAQQNEVFPQMRWGGFAIVGGKKKKATMGPSLPIGAPYPDTWGMNNGDTNGTPAVPPVAMPTGAQPYPGDNMPVNQNLDHLWDTKYYADGGDAWVGGDPMDSQGLPGGVRAPEPIIAVGLYSRRPYFEAGEAGLEQISVRPIRASMARGGY